MVYRHRQVPVFKGYYFWDDLICADIMLRREKLAKFVLRHCVQFVIISGKEMKNRVF